MTPRPRHKAARSILLAYRRLLRGESLTTGKLAEDWDEQPRNTRMWMEILEELPEVELTQDGAQKGLSLARGRAWVTVEPELGVIMALGKHVLQQFAGTRFHRRFERLFEELDNAPGVKPGFVRRQWAKFVVRHTSGHGHAAELEPLLDALLISLDLEHRLAFDYTNFEGQTRGRVVDPLSLIIHGDELYLAARQEGALKFFSLFGIHNARVLDEPFEYPGVAEYDPERHLATGLGIWPADRDTTWKLVLRFSPRLKTWVHRHRWHPSQRTLDLPDGAVQVEMLLPWNPEVRRYILGFGPDVEVVAPTHARDDIRKALQRALTTYDELTDANP